MMPLAMDLIVRVLELLQRDDRTALSDRGQETPLVYRPQLISGPST